MLVAATCPEWVRDDLFERVRPFRTFWSPISDSLVIENAGTPDFSTGYGALSEVLTQNICVEIG